MKVAAMASLALVVFAAPDARACDSDVPLASAIFTPHHAPSRAGELTWDARYIVAVDAAFDFRGGRVPLASALPPGETLVPAAGITPVYEGDRITALCVEPSAIRNRTIAAQFVQPSHHQGPSRPAPDTSRPLGAPVAACNAVQVIDVDLTDGRLEIEGPGLEKHVGYVAPRAIGHAARDEAQRLTELRPRLDRSPVFVRGEDARGLSARFVDGRTQARRSALSIGALFAFVVAALAMAARRLKNAAAVERADAVLSAEIASLER